MDTQHVNLGEGLSALVRKGDKGWWGEIHRFGRRIAVTPSKLPTKEAVVKAAELMVVGLKR